jgi:hypothetical protein
MMLKLDKKSKQKKTDTQSSFRHSPAILLSRVVLNLKYLSSRYTKFISSLPDSFTFQSCPKPYVSLVVRVPLLLLYYTKIIGFRQGQNYEN